MAKRKWVRGFHGTTSLAAKNITADGWQKTLGGGHWLGAEGIYFAPEDFDLAKSFAEAAVARTYKKSGVVTEPVVFEALIDLTNCFDLRLIRYKLLLEKQAKSFLRIVPPEVWREILQSQISRSLDSMVIGNAMKTLRTADGKPYSSLIAIVPKRYGKMPPQIVPPARPLYKVRGARDRHGNKLRSWFNFHDHEQLIVYDDQRIHRLRIVSQPD